MRENRPQKNVANQKPTKNTFGKFTKKATTHARKKQQKYEKTTNKTMKRALKMPPK